LIVNYITFGSDTSYSNLQRSSTRSLQERSLDIGKALKSVNLIQSSLDCRENVEQFNHQCFERNAKICEPLDIEAKQPWIFGRQIMRDNVEAESSEDYFRKSLTVPFLYLKWKQGLPTYTPEPLWDYIWFPQLLKILLHNWAPPSTESLDPPLHCIKQSFKKIVSLCNVSDLK
jgi:hypothetical protein